MKNDVLNDLISTSSISEDTIEIFSSHTRDNSNLNVKIDTSSGGGVIFIEDFFVGNLEYQDGNYKENSNKLRFDEFESYEDKQDSKRRVNDFKQYIKDKNVCDFGCGKGSFLRLAREYSNSLYGVELQKNYISLLKNNGISCEDKINKHKVMFDTIFSFHTLEHLPNQIEVLKNLKNYINFGGNLIIEVPHANDFLLKNLQVEEFKEFTLWSQHLVLHTKKSLNNFLTYSGYKDIEIFGIQRYSIANHLGWLMNKKPGGHMSELANIETPELIEEYQNALKKADATDTLIAIAKV
jgi:2-polyprenyl-3-methyl-5-hydroxy-6-metoxy-1,4-benzoquinol methylase